MDNYMSNMSSYGNGWAAGKQETLLKVQAELHEVALNSADHRIGPEEIDEVIYKLLED